MPSTGDKVLLSAEWVENEVEVTTGTATVEIVAVSGAAGRERPPHRHQHGKRLIGPERVHGDIAMSILVRYVCKVCDDDASTEQGVIDHLSQNPTHAIVSKATGAA
jgi:hypothetical protein